jgi:imidazolonepropionase-like amidohydrolase
VALVCFLAGCGDASEKAADNSKAAPTSDLTYFSGARLIPGDGSPPIEDSAFIMENGKFKEIGKKSEVKPPKGSSRVELDGRTITPVLFNLHGHIGINTGKTTSVKNYKRESVISDLNRYAYYGVEAVAVLGTDVGDLAFEIRDEQQQGKGSGARLFTAGRGITSRGGWPTSILPGIPIEVSTEAEARKAVRDQVAKKVDFIKIWVDDNMGRAPKLKPELYHAVIDEARKSNTRVVAHVFYLADAKDLVKSGVAGLVHSIRDREVDNELISAMKEKNVFYTPTLTAHEAKFTYAERPKWLGEQIMREVYPPQLSAYLSDDVTVNRFKRNPDLAALRQQYETAEKNLVKMASAGVKIGLGTDSGSADTYPGYFELRELELMAAAGMKPADVIKAATSASADVLGLKDMGTLAVGKNADFIVFENNPLEKMSNVKDIASIYMNGAELDRRLILDKITSDVPKITQQDRQADAQAQADAARKAADAKLEHYGPFPLGTAANLRSLSVPTPKYSKSDIKPGPPDRITVSMQASPVKASAAELRAFYSKALPRYRWTPAGSCWEKKHPTSSKTETLCVETNSNVAVIQITEK